MMDWLRGIIPVLPTPFDDTGTVDFEGFSSVIEAAIRDGAHAVAMFGLASEYYKLSDEERDSLTRVLVRVVEGRVPVIVSITEHSTEVATRHAVAAEDAGATALMLLPPFFLHPPNDAVIEHIRAVTSAVDIPVILQYAPQETGVSGDVLECLPVSALKVDCFPSAPTVHALAQRLQCFIGYMGLDLPEAFSAGCAGCMPTASLVRPFAKIWDLLEAGDESGKELHESILPLLEFMMQSIEFVIAAEKQLLLSNGVIRSAYCRRPAARLDTNDCESLLRLSGRVHERVHI